jgi:hypothetical protein
VHLEVGDERFAAAKSNAFMKPMTIRCGSLSDRARAPVLQGYALSRPHALRHQATLGRTAKRLAVRAHCFASAGVPLALPHEALTYFATVSGPYCPTVFAFPSTTWLGSRRRFTREPSLPSVEPIGRERAGGRLSQKRCRSLPAIRNLVRGRHSLQCSRACGAKQTATRDRSD